MIPRLLHRRGEATKYYLSSMVRAFKAQASCPPQQRRRKFIPVLYANCLGFFLVFTCTPNACHRCHQWRPRHNWTRWAQNMLCFVGFDLLHFVLVLFLGDRLIGRMNTVMVEIRSVNFKCLWLSLHLVRQARAFHLRRRTLSAFSTEQGGGGCTVP
jgi:hypothetical protein